MFRRHLATAIISGLLLGTAMSAQAIEVPALQKSLKPATQDRLKTYEAAARQGDYQAMRNFAYTWSTDAAKEQPAAAIVGCAWYALILKVHPLRVNDGDRSNKDLYCGRLSIEQARQAGAMVSQLEPRLAAK